jgi:hypothetical protein
MDNLVEFVGLGSLIALSMIFALWLEWLALRALLVLMPGRAHERQLDHADVVSRRAVHLAKVGQLATVKIRA